MSSLSLHWRAAIAASAGLAVVVSGAATTAASAASAPGAVTGPSLSTAAVPATAARGADDSSWFVDPRTPAQRRTQLAVPKRPERYSGRLRETRAVYRTRAGSLAVPMHWAMGHQLVRGQALTLDGQGLFKGGSAVLTPQAKAQLRRASDSLTNASSLRCEGYADYGSNNADDRRLSKARAQRVCATIAELNPGLDTTAVSYGSTRPAVLGGKPAQRDKNRRVVIQMTGTRPAKPNPPTPPVGPNTPDAKVPGAPTLVHMKAYDGVVHYAFAAPTSDGGAPITAYQVSTGGAWTAVTSAPARRSTTREPCRDCDELIYAYLPGVLDESTVNLRVRAVNRIGAGAPSNTLTTTVVGLPSEPTAFSVTSDNHVITTTFAAPTRDGGSEIQGYEISYDGGLSWAIATTPGTGPWTITTEGFANGVSYDVAVRALNDRGYGPIVMTKVLVAAVPDAPWLDNQVATDGTSAALTFTSPQLDDGTNGGSPITRYEITFDGQTWSTFPYAPDADHAGRFSFVLSDLDLGKEYAVALRAVNDRGPGTPSKTRTFTPAVEPDAPAEVDASVDGTTVTLTITAPAFNGGAPITGYEVHVIDDIWAKFVPASSTITLTDQAPGQRSYEVRAINRIGASVEAATSNNVTITAPTPNAPTINNYGYYGAGEQVAVLFTAGSNNGATVTGYEMSVEGGPWLASDSVLNGNQAMFDCPGMTCGWNYGSSIRLRAVTSTGVRSPISAPYASNPI